MPAEYKSVCVDFDDSGLHSIYGVETPDGDTLATDECAGLLNTLIADLTRVTAERDEALALLREWIYYEAEPLLYERTDALLAKVQPQIAEALEVRE